MGQNTRSHLINARTSRKRQHLRSETVETQPNHHFPPVAPAQVLWVFCNRAIYEISSSFLTSDAREPQSVSPFCQLHLLHVAPRFRKNEMSSWFCNFSRIS